MVEAATDDEECETDGTGELGGLMSKQEDRKDIEIKADMGIPLEHRCLIPPSIIGKETNTDYDMYQCFECGSIFVLELLSKVDDIPRAIVCPWCGCYGDKRIEIG